MKRNALGSLGRGGAPLGKVEEYFLEQLSPGDTFLFSGKVLRFEGIRENECLASQAFSMDPKIPSYAGGKFPLSTYLADQVRTMISDPERRHRLPDQVRDWLELQKDRSLLPKRDELLIETLSARQPRLHGRLSLRRTVGAPDAWHAVDAAAGAGRRKADGLRRHGLFTRHLGAGGHGPDDCQRPSPAFPISSTRICSATISKPWLDESFLLKRTFRNCAVIAGLIERRHPGKEKTGRQVTVSADPDL